LYQDFKEEINKRKNTDGSVIFIGAEWRENAKNSMARSALVSSLRRAFREAGNGGGQGRNGLGGLA
jgi:hypothetical protein